MLYPNARADDNQRSMRTHLSSILSFGVAIALLPLAALASDKPRPAPPTKPAAEYPLHEVHEKEKVTIAAEPCNDPAECKFFRLQYVQHGFLPVRVIVTNDRDQALVLDDVRIQFLPEEGEREGAATDEDLNRRLFTQKSTVPTKIPLIPLSIKKEAGGPEDFERRHGFRVPVDGCAGAQHAGRIRVL